jgi:hypothetical protein
LLYFGVVLVIGGRRRQRAYQRRQQRRIRSHRRRVNDFCLLLMKFRSSNFGQRRECTYNL